LVYHCWVKRKRKIKTIVPVERIEHSILFIRGQKVILDSSLAGLYGVTTGNLNLAIRRNISRFPSDFMFQITEDESEDLILQFAISKPGRGGRRYLPYVFTEYGVAMLSSVLNSERAVQVNIEIMRTFGRLRRILASHKMLAKKLHDLEEKYDRKFRIIFKAIHDLMNEPDESPKSPIGFRVK